MNFLLHWIKLVRNLALKANTIIAERSRWTISDCVSSNVMKMHAGHHGLLAPFDDFLLRYVFKLCEQGMVVMMQIVLRKASNLCQIFHAKQGGAKSFIVYRWLKAQGFRYQMGTYESQHSPSEAASDSLNFMQEIKKVSKTSHEKNTLSL